MSHIVDVNEALTLHDYAAYGHLAPAVHDLRAFAETARAALQDRTVWMVNSTAQGGGVAEMLPRLVSTLRELGVQTEWAVIESEDERFFDLTKRVHNLLHGSGPPHLSAEDHAFYEAESHRLADRLSKKIAPGDLLVIHDPQPLAVGALLKEQLDVQAVWRCHIGLDEETPATRAAWDFLKPWTLRYDRVVFSIEAYVPSFLTGRAAIIPPAVDPLSHKNRELSVHKLGGILTNAALADAANPVLTPPFDTPAQRLQPGGRLTPAHHPDDLGLLFRPIVTQVSRWDRLKGFGPLLDGFARLKTERNGEAPARHQRRLDLVRLVLAGPDPVSVEDDPEGAEVFEDLRARWQALPEEVQRDVAVLALPMQSRKENALIVNALQRCSTVVVQNSLREGFGLTVTEAMLKGRPVMGTHAVGIREQVQDGEQGCLVRDAEDPEEIAETLGAMLAQPGERERWGRNAQRRIVEQFLVFSQVRRWLALLSRSERPVIE